MIRIVRNFRAILALILVLWFTAVAHAETTVSRNLTRTLPADESVYHQGTVPAEPVTVIVDNWGEGCILIDDQSATFSTGADAWTYNEDTTPTQWESLFGTSHYIAKDNVDGSGTATFTPTIPETKDYHVWWYKWIQAGTTYATNQPITVVYNGGSANHTVNNAAQGGGWEYLGTYEFAAGTGGYVVTNNNADAYIQADAVIFQPAENKPIIVLDDDDAAYVITGAWTDYSHNYCYLGDLQYTTVNGGDKYITATPTIVTAGNYRVWSKSNNASAASRCSGTEYIVTHNGAGSPSTVLINQEINPGKWVVVGVYPFAAGTGGNVQITNEDDGCNTPTTDVVIADGLMFEYVGETTGNWAQYWQHSTQYANYYGHDYLRITGGGSATDCFVWPLAIPQDGTYKVSVMSAGVSCNSVDFIVSHSGGSHTYAVDQTGAGNIGEWIYLASLPFDTSGSYKVSVCADNCTSAKYVAADAVKLELMYQTPFENAHNIYTDHCFREKAGMTDTGDKATYIPSLRAYAYQTVADSDNRAYWMLPDGDPTIVDEESASYAGAWTSDSLRGYNHDGKYIASGDGSATATYAIDASAADYEVSLMYALQATERAGSQFCSNCPWTVNYDGGSDAQTIDMDTDEGSDENEYKWDVLGVYPFAAGTGNTVVATNLANNNLVFVDAVRFQKIKEFTQASDFGFRFKTMTQDYLFQPIVGLFDSGTASNVTNFVGIKINTSQYSLFDIYPQIYDNAGNSDAGTASENIHRSGLTIEIVGQYLTSNDTLTVTGYNPETGIQLFTASKALTGGRSFSVNSFGIGTNGDNASAYSGWIWDIAVWSGTSETYRTSSQIVYAPTSFDLPFIAGYGHATPHCDPIWFGGGGSFTEGSAIGTGVPTIIRINNASDKTYFGFVGRDLYYYMSEYYHSDGTVSLNPTQIPAANDDHGHSSFAWDGTDIHMFGGAHYSDLIYYKSDGENIRTFTLQDAEIATWATYPFADYISGSTKLVVTYRRGLAGNSDPASVYMVTSTDGGATWSAETQVTDELDNATGTPYGVVTSQYPILADQAENGDIYRGISVIDQHSLLDPQEGMYVIKYDGTNWENVEGDTLTLPIAIPGEDRTVAAISGTSIDCNPDDDWTVNYWAPKWVQVKTCAATPGIEGNWYTIASNDADQIVTDTDLAALGLAASDTVFIGEKYVNVFPELPGAGDVTRYPGDMHVYGAGAAPFVCGTSYDDGTPSQSNAERGTSYFWKWDYANNEWDVTTIDDDFHAMGVWVQSESGGVYTIDAYGPADFEDAGPPHSVLAKFTSTDSGATWSRTATIHSPYWGDIGNGYKARPRFRTCLPKHECSTDFMFGITEAIHPQGLFQTPDDYGFSEVMGFGTSDSTYLMNHKVNSVSFTATGAGSGTVQLRCASTEYGLRSANWETVTNGDTSFVDAGFNTADFVQAQVINISGEYKIEDLIVTIGGVPFQLFIMQNSNQFDGGTMQ